MKRYLHKCEYKKCDNMTKNRRFCSDECWYNRGREKIVHNCEYCGKLTINAHYCSHSCANHISGKIGGHNSQKILKEQNKGFYNLEVQRRLRLLRLGTHTGEHNPMFGRKHSEKTIDKMKTSHIGKSTWLKGLTKDTDERVRLLAEKLRGKLKSNKAKQNMSIAQKGLVHSNKHNKNISKGLLKNFKEHPERLNKLRKMMSGENNPMFNNWSSRKLYGISWSPELKTLVRKRDSFTCAICNKNGFSVHHIDYNKRNNSLTNLITLCRNCHAKTNFNRQYYKEKINNMLLTNIKNDK